MQHDIRDIDIKKTWVLSSTLNFTRYFFKQRYKRKFVIGDHHRMIAEKLDQSLKEFPEMMELRPIIVDDNNIIQGGNMRYRALKELGYKEIPDTWVKKGKDLTPEQWREFVVKDSKEIYDFITETNDRVIAKFKTINKSVRRAQLWHGVVEAGAAAAGRRQPGAADKQ